MLERRWLLYVLFVCSVSECVICLFFFFKQKTAYEMRISDWSSDVCSSDLTVIAYGALYGACPLLHAYNAAGALAALIPLHPSTVTVEWDKDAGDRKSVV